MLSQSWKVDNNMGISREKSSIVIAILKKFAIFSTKNFSNFGFTNNIFDCRVESY